MCRFFQRKGVAAGISIGAGIILTSLIIIVVVLLRHLRRARLEAKWPHKHQKYLCGRISVRIMRVARVNLRRLPIAIIWHVHGTYLGAGNDKLCWSFFLRREWNLTIKGWFSGAKEDIGSNDDGNGSANSPSVSRQTTSNSSWVQTLVYHTSRRYLWQRTGYPKQKPCRMNASL